MKNSVLDVSSVEAISRALKVNRNDFINAFKAVRADMEKKMHDIVDFGQQFGVYSPVVTVKPKVNVKVKIKPKVKTKVKPKIKTRIKTSKKPSHKASAPKSKTPRKPKNTAKVGRKAKHPSGMTLVQAVAKIVRNSQTGPVGNNQVTEAVKAMGFKSKSIGVQVSQSFNKLFQAGYIVKTDLGLYSAGKPMPVVVIEPETTIVSQ